MENIGTHFFSWLAAEPAFVQVMLGVLFNLILAPVLVGAVAVGVTAIEGVFERSLQSEAAAGAWRALVRFDGKSRLASLWTALFTLNAGTGNARSTARAKRSYVMLETPKQ